MRQFQVAAALLLTCTYLTISPVLANSSGGDVKLYEPEVEIGPNRNMETQGSASEGTMYDLYKAKDALARKASSRCVIAGSTYMNNECEAANGASCNCEEDCDCEADEDSCECDCGGILPWQ